jgi:hypothetical protein
LTDASSRPPASQVQRTFGPEADGRIEATLHALQRCALLVAGALGAAASTVAAQELPSSPVGRAAEAITIDGRLDEGAWTAAPTIGRLTMVEPAEGLPPTFETEVRIIADQENLYIGVHAFDSDPGQAVAYSKARDSQLRSEDHLKFVLDPFLDGQSGFVFAVNPGGARYDALVTEQGLGENSSWDAVWEARTSTSADRWTVEVRIPIRSLTFDAALDAWGFNVERRVQRIAEVSRWASPLRTAPIAQTSRAGRITNLPAFHTGLGMTVRGSLAGGVSRGGPGTDWEGDLEPSLDVFQRLGSNATLSATVNTDFAETEVDTRRTNLTRFPLFFPEKRAFFLEGADIFDFGSGLSTFHSQDILPFFTRRIGLLDGQQVPIRVGGKVSGRDGRTNFGGLVANAGSVEGLVDASTMGAFRVKRNVLEQSSIGALATFGDPEGRADSYMVGIDGVYNTSRFLGSRNLIVGAWGLVTGRDGLDGDRTAFGGIIDFPNDEWDLWLSYKRIGDGFDPSLGFVPRRGVHLANLGVNYRWWSPTSSIRNLYFELVPIFAWDLGGRLESYRIFTAPLNLRLESGDRIEFNVQPQGERLPGAFEISDGVIIPEGSYDWVRYRAEVDFAAQRLLSGRVSWWFGPFYDGNVSELSVRLAINPSDLMTFEVSGTRNSGTLPGGELLQEVLGTRVRVNFSSDLQVSVFGQYERESGEFGVNSRLRWTFHPLGDLFVIYNDNALDEEGVGWRRESSQLLVKLQYALRY